MRIFVYEYLCSGILANQPAAASLHREGLAMLAAVSGDLSRCPGIELLTLLDPALLTCASIWPPNLVARPVRGPEQEREAFHELTRQADAAFLIAPEFDDLLWQRCRWVEDLGVPLLGPGSAAVRQTGDKLELARFWQQAGVSTPDCWTSAEAVAQVSTLPWPRVLKPRHGAGSQATFLAHNQDAFSSCLAQARAEGWQGELVVQPYAAGMPASVALLIGARQTLALPAARQHLSADGRFHYQGGCLPLPAEEDQRVRRLALQAVRPVKGLRGYVGVDLVLGEAEDGSEDRAIEINPRLTTSYVGLRALADFNLAAALLAVLSGAPVPDGPWRSGPIQFRADGCAAADNPSWQREG